MHAHRARAEAVDGLVRARAALRAGNTEQALELARAAVDRSAREGRAAASDAYVVLGLVHMRRNEPALGLAAFDAALEGTLDDASDRPVIAFNRGVCLFDLERYDEAERSFLAAAEQARGSLGALAMLNAGFAAYEAGAPANARAHLTRAKQLDPDNELAAQLAELEADLDASPAADNATVEEGDENPSAVARYQAGIAAYGRGAWSTARSELTTARALGLDEDRDAAALAYLDLISGGLRRAGRELNYSIELGVGYDSNVTQNGLGDSNALLDLQSSAEADAFGRAQLGLGYGAALSEPTFMRVDYGVQQLMYSKETIDVMNAQDHDLTVALEHRLTPVVRVQGSLLGSLSLMGLRDLRPLSWSGGGEATLGFDYGDGFASEASVLVLGTDVLAEELPFLAGHRIEVELAQEYRQRGLSVGGELGYRVESLGTQTFQTEPPDDVCPDCSGETAIPLSYDGPGIALWGSKRLTSWLRCGVRASIDWRMHRDPTGFVVSTSFGREFEGTVRTQRDKRLQLSMMLTAELWGPLETQLSYGILKGLSNIDNTQGGDHALDYSNLNFTRHVIELSLIASE